MKLTSSKRVVVTGLGIISSIGIGWKDFWKNLLAGKSGISKVETFSTADYERHYAGEVKNFDPTKFINKRKVERMGRASQMAIAASKLALKDASITMDEIPKEKTGVCFGTTMGEPQIMEKANEKYLKNAGVVKFDLLSSMAYPASSIPNYVSLAYGLKGPSEIYATACASGNYAIGKAFDIIQSGACEMMLAGGADALSRIAFTGFGRLFAMSPGQCKPFDKNRRGMLLGEGSAVLVLESLDHAFKRKADIYAEVLGYGLSCDAHHMTQPSSNGIAKAIKKAIMQAGIKAVQVGYISAHGTGTTENDKAESKAIYAVFGEQAKQIPVSSIKSMLGHTMGAASTSEAIACCLAIHEEEIPPTINFEEKDPECDIDCVPNFSRKKILQVALNNSSAFGGNNACLALGRYHS